ncbi:hypothetical protein PRK78_004733 [Emydomyces testavorans]|uniref:Uncharacterized protein n=1 Tax=Emydomyces testavorans TaxID=2070801 RepID=A0AAF0ILZ0_9EURO|nr:hypothetical protein PRK78_004733 [Emydomyces testavorans]
MKDTVELTGKLVMMESRHPLAESARPMGLVHLVNPKLSLHLVDEIDKRVEKWLSSTTRSDEDDSGEC